MPRLLRFRPALLVLMVVLLLSMVACGGDDDDGPVAPPAAGPVKVLVLADGGTEDEVIRILTDAGLDVTAGPRYQDYDASDIQAYETVVLLNGVDYREDIPDSVQQAYLTYLAEGGGLIVTEWMIYYASRYEILVSALPVLDSDNYEYEPETYTRLIDHPIAAGLPDTFAVGSDTTAVDWTWIQQVPDDDPAKQVQVVYEGSMSGPAVVAGRYGQGRTVAWGMAGEYDGDDIWIEMTERLLVNMVSWSAGR